MQRTLAGGARNSSIIQFHILTVIHFVPPTSSSQTQLEAQQKIGNEKFIHCLNHRCSSGIMASLRWKRRLFDFAADAVERNEIILNK